VLALIAIALAMGITDVLSTALVIAEARGRGVLAGSLDAAGDVSRIVYTALGVHALDQLNSTSAVTLLVVCATSFVVTTFATRIVSQWLPDHRDRWAEDPT
jgi:hypothetical protein